MNRNELMMPHKSEGRTNPVFTTACAIKAAAIVQPKPIIEGLLREGEQLMLYSRPGAGKSWFALSLAIAAATGTSICVNETGEPKWKAPEGTKVLYLDGELDASDLGKRIELLDPQNTLEKVGNLMILSRQQQDFTAVFPNLADIGDSEALIQYCIDEKVSVLVLDNLTTLSHITDENSASAFTPIINGLLMRLKSVGVACVLVHHSNKTDGGYRGSSALATTFNAIIHLKPEPLQRGAFTLHFQKARNQHIESESLRVELKQKSQGDAIQLICDSSVSKLEQITHLVRSREYSEDKEIMEALAHLRGEDPYNKGTFSKWKQKCIADNLITLSEWSNCLAEAKELDCSELEPL